MRLTDLDTDCLLHDGVVEVDQLRSTRRHYLRVRIEVWGGQSGELVLCHDYSARDRDVLIQFPADTLGDALAWFPCAEKFQALHDCRLKVAMPTRFFALFRDAYRVINWHVCNSCWNDVRLRFNDRGFLWCPRQKDTPRQFECTRLITHGQVINTIKRIPNFCRRDDKA